MLYFGPETYLPLASVVAGAAGLALTFWRRLVGFMRRTGARLSRRPPAKPGPAGRDASP